MTQRVRCRRSQVRLVWPVLVHGAAGAALAACRRPRPTGSSSIKAERRLYLVRGGEVLRSYQVALGRQPKGTKLYQGDGRTPEGTYEICGVQRAGAGSTARCASPIRTSRTGRGRGRWGRRPAGTSWSTAWRRSGATYRHEHWRFNWTNGCIAVTDKEIEEIWQRVEIGTPIEIRP